MDIGKRIELEQKVNRILDIINKPAYSENDILELQNFIRIDESGESEFGKLFYDGLLDLSLRTKLLDIKAFYLSQKNSKINSGLSNLYKDNNTFFELLEVYLDYLDSPELLEDLSSIELDSLLFDFYDHLRSQCELEYIELLLNKMDVKDFQISRCFYAATKLVNQKNEEKFKDFAKQYIRYVKEGGENLDFDKDPFLIKFSDEVKHELERYYNTVILVHDKLLSEEPKTVSTQELQAISLFVASILSHNRETAIDLSQSDKKILKSFFERYYHLCLNDFNASLDKLEFITDDGRKYQELLFRELVKAQRYGFRSSEDEQFRKDNFPDIAKDIGLVKDNDEKRLEYLCLLTIDEDVTQRLIDYIYNTPSADGSYEHAYKSRAVNRYLETYIYLLLDGIPIHSKSHNFVRTYLNNRTLKPDFNIFDEQYVSDIMQLINADKIDEPLKSEFYAIIIGNLGLSEINAEEVKNELYLQIDSCTIPVLEEEMDKICQNIQKIKLVNGRIYDKKIFNFFLSQVLDENSSISTNPKKYQGFVERMLEDYARFDLSPKAKDICFFIRDFLGFNKLKGNYYPDTAIEYKRENIQELIKKKNLDIFATIFHENIHAVQYYDIEHSKFDNYYRYLMLKERIIRSIDNNFYVKNYKSVFLEIEARLTSSEKVRDMILGLPENVKKQIFEKNGEQLKEDILRGKREYKKGHYKRNIFKKGYPKESLTTIFDQIIQEHPEVLKENPTLKIEYNEDGSLKKPEDVLNDLNDNGCASNQMMMYMQIVFGGEIFKEENFENDINTLLNYDIKNPNAIIPISLLYVGIIKKFFADPEIIPESFYDSYISAISRIQQKIEELKKKEENNGLTNNEQVLKIVMSHEISEQSIEMILENTKSELKERIEVNKKVAESVERMIFGQFGQEEDSFSSQSDRLLQAQQASLELMRDSYKKTTAQERHGIRGFFDRLKIKNGKGKHPKKQTRTPKVDKNAEKGSTEPSKQ